jgi:Ribosomal RNA adenine dimethylase
MLSLLMLRSKCTKLVGQIKIENFSTARKTRRAERTPRRTSQETPERAPTVVVIGDALSESSRTVKKRKNVLPIRKHSTTEAENENESAGGQTSPLSQSTETYSRSRMYDESSNDDQTEQADESRSSVTPLLFPQKTTRPLFAEASHRPKAKLTFSKKKFTEEDGEDVRDRPFTLPSGQFKPKQSLGQNFLSDQNYVLKICDAFKDSSPDGLNVVEIGPGPGALTRVLYPRYPAMTAIEIDERAVAFLGEKLPGK